MLSGISRSLVVSLVAAALVFLILIACLYSVTAQS